MAMAAVEAPAVPALVSSMGLYLEAMPAPALRAHFRCVWMQAIAADSGGPATVVPDGCVDILWRNGRLSVAGPDMTASSPVLRPGSTVVGLRFQPGAARAWLGLPMREIVGREVLLEDLWGYRARKLAERLLGAPDPGRQAALLQSLLLPDRARVASPAAEAAAMIHLLHATEYGAPGSVTALRAELALSERTLRRRSEALFGYGPRTLGRILRFQHFQALVHRPGPGSLVESDGCEDGPIGTGLAALAAAAGYADQAHLSREVRALVGMTPRAFVRQLAG